MSAPHERGEADLLRLIARAMGGCELDQADVAASGRSAWTWHHVDEEAAALLGGHWRQSIDGIDVIPVFCALRKRRP